MKKLLFFSLFITFCYILSNVDDASAKIKSSMAEVGFFGGAIMLDESTGTNDKALVGLDLTVHYTEDWALNISFMNELSEFDKLPSFNFYTVSGEYKFAPKYSLSPYLLLGIGAGTLIPDPDTNRIHFVFTAGGGAKYFIMKRVALKAEIRDYITTNEISHNIAGTIGIMYIFDLLAPFGTSSESAEPLQTTIQKQNAEGDRKDSHSDEVDEESSSDNSLLEQDEQPDEAPGGTEMIEEDIEEISPETIKATPQQDTPPSDNLPVIEEKMNEPSDTDSDSQTEGNDSSSDAPGFKVLER